MSEGRESDQACTCKVISEWVGQAGPGRGPGREPRLPPWERLRVEKGVEGRAPLASARFILGLSPETGSQTGPSGS